MMLDAYMWDWTSHRVIDTSAVKAYTFEPKFISLYHELSDVVSIATSCKSMHDEKDGWILYVFILVTPVKANIASILEEYSLAFEGVLKFGLH